MRVLVTGATGFLGGNLLRMLCDDGHSVSYLSREGKVARAATDYPQAVCVEGDLCDASFLEKACKNIDWIFHAAAIVSSLEQDRPMMVRVNVDGTKALFEAARNAGVPRFIHVSTVDTIGKDPEKPITNEGCLGDFSALRNPYPDTKSMAEEYLLQNQNIDTQVIIINPGYMIGALDTHGTSSRIVKEIMENRGVFAPAGGNSFVDVKDVCRGAILAAEKGKNGERYILAGHNLSYKDFFTRVAQLAHAATPLAVLPSCLTLAVAAMVEKSMSFFHLKPLFTWNDAVFSLMQHYYSSEKACRELGYSIHAIEPAISDAIFWYKQQED